MNKFKERMLALIAAATGDEKIRLETILKSVRAVGLKYSFALKLAEDKSTVEKARVAIGAELMKTTTPITSAAPSTTPAGGENKIKNRAVPADVISAVRASKLPGEFALTLLEKGHSMVKARKLIIAELAKTDTSISGNHSRVTADTDLEKKVEGMQEAIMVRAGVTGIKPTELSAEYRNMSLIEIARETLDLAGVNTRGMSTVNMLREISRRSGSMAIGDFPIILGNTINRTLRQMYELQERTFQPFCRQANARDFRPVTRTQLGDVNSFDKIPEGGEYRAGKMGEAKETYALSKYGKIIPLTWEMIVNDDLSAFGRIPTSIAQQAAQKQSDIVYGILSANAAMSDGTALFHADHGNLPTAAAISVDGLSASRTAMRKQTSIGGSRLNLQPKYLIVPPEKELLANQFTSLNYVATQGSLINPKFNTSLQVIVESRLASPKWYLAADPGQIDTIEYAFLEGEGELFTEQKMGFDSDGLQIKARMTFAAKAIDWRGLVYNSGV